MAGVMAGVVWHSSHYIFDLPLQPRNIRISAPKILVVRVVNHHRNHPKALILRCVMAMVKPKKTQGISIQVEIIINKRVPKYRFVYYLNFLLGNT